MGIPDIEGCVSKSFDIQEKFNINNREHLGTIQSHTHIHSSTKQSPDVVNEIDQDGRFEVLPGSRYQQCYVLGHSEWSQRVRGGMFQPGGTSKVLW